MTDLLGRWKVGCTFVTGDCLTSPVHTGHLPGMRAITFYGILFGLSVLTASTKAQNLLQNGSFQTGDFTDWTVTGNAQVESGVPTSFGTYAAVLNSGSSTPNAVLTQSFSAAVGQAYQLSFDYGPTAKSGGQSIISAITDADGNTLVDSSYDGAAGNNSYYRTYTAIFVATTPTMTVGFRDISSLTATQDGLLDNVQVYAIPAFSHSGEYVGTDVETLSYYGHNIVQSRTLTVKMEIDAAGRMLVLLNPAYENTVGTINDAGVVTLGTTGDFQGTATFTGNHIEFNVTEYGSAGGNFSYSTLVNTRKYNIQRVGPAK
jgi:hypothetical protein